MQVEGLNCQSSLNYSKCKGSWLHISNNGMDTSDEYQYEWTMIRYGKRESQYSAWDVESRGYITDNQVNSNYAVRPVFYLKSDIKLSEEGNGSKENPFVVEA